MRSCWCCHMDDPLYTVCGLIVLDWILRSRRPFWGLGPSGASLWSWRGCPERGPGWMLEVVFMVFLRCSQLDHIERERGGICTERVFSLCWTSSGTRWCFCAVSGVRGVSCGRDAVVVLLLSCCCIVHDVVLLYSGYSICSSLLYLYAGYCRMDGVVYVYCGSKVVQRYVLRLDTVLPTVSISVLHHNQLYGYCSTVWCCRYCVPSAFVQS